jgi:hypothetical protein
MSHFYIIYIDDTAEYLNFEQTSFRNLNKYLPNYVCEELSIFLICITKTLICCWGHFIDNTSIV